ncbi:MAG: class I SAM-dependent methyltransferase [Rubrivivax sp.]|nr:class I SAM-dependent methyltransferase [Rubrivivax sp.]
MSAAAPRPCPVCARPEPRPLYTKDGYRIVQCAGCALAYVADDPAAIDFDALYGESYYRGGSDAVFADYLGQEAARRAQARRRLAWLRHVPPRWPRSGRLLDVGCAAGFFLAEAQAHYDVQGVELSTWSAAHARERLGLPVLTGTLQQAALPAASVDIVTLWDVIEHVPEPVPLLAEAARVMKPGALLVLTTGDWGSAYAQARGADWHLMTPPWHLTYFSRATLAEAARRAGLRVRSWQSEGVGGDGRYWRSRTGLVLTRLLDRGDIVRATFVK